MSQVNKIKSNGCIGLCGAKIYWTNELNEFMNFDGIHAISIRNEWTAYIGVILFRFRIAIWNICSISTNPLNNVTAVTYETHTLSLHSTLLCVGLGSFVSCERYPIKISCSKLETAAIL